MVIGVSDLLGAALNYGTKKLAEAITDTPQPQDAGAPLTENQINAQIPDAIQQQEVPNFKGASTFDSDPRHVSLYKAFRELGQTDFSAKALVAEVGRENAFQDKYLFGDHTDPANGRTNAGIFSWQKSRRDELVSRLTSKGFYQDGKIARSYDALKEMAAFAIDEMNSPAYGGGKITSYLNSENPDPETAFRMLGKDYIKWRYDDPKYAKHHQHRNDWFSRVSNAVSQMGPVLEYMKAQTKPENARYNDFSASKQAQEDLSKINSFAKKDYGVMEKLSAYYDASMGQSEHTKLKLQRQTAEDYINKLQKETGVPFQKPETSAEKLMRFSGLNGETTSTGLLNNAWEASVTSYLEKIAAERPDYNPEYKSVGDIKMAAGAELMRRESVVSQMSEEDGLVTKLAYGLVGGFPTMLTDPVNVAAMVATAPLGGTGVLANMAIQGGVNAAVEGVQAGIEAASNTRSEMGLPEMSIEEAGTRITMGGLMGGAIGGLAAGASKVATKATKTLMPDIDARPPQTVAEAYNADVSDMIGRSPTVDTPIGQEVLKEGINKATRDVLAGKPVVVVPDNIPPVRMEFTERTGIDVDTYSHHMSDLNYDREAYKKAFQEIDKTVLDTPTITSEVYTSKIKAASKEELDYKQASLNNQTQADYLKSLLKDRIPKLEETAGARAKANTTSLQNEIVEERLSRALDNKISRSNAGEVTSPELREGTEGVNIAQEAPQIPTEISGRIESLNGRVNRADVSLNRLANTRQASAFKKAELANELRAAKEQFKTDKNMSKERKKEVLDDINEDLRLETATHSWANKQIKRWENVKNKSNEELADIQKKYSEANDQSFVSDEPQVSAPKRGPKQQDSQADIDSRVAKIYEDEAALSKELADLEQSSSGEGIYLLDDLDEGTTSAVTREAFEENLSQERSTMELLINCVLGK